MRCALVLSCGALLSIACSDQLLRSRSDEQPKSRIHVPGVPLVATKEPQPCERAECEPSAREQRFVIIGDYGQSGEAEAKVAALVDRLKPDFVLTTGDNNYPYGQAETIDENIGRYFHAFIAPYQGKFGPGAEDNRFFPSLGNHDWYTAGAQPYLDYFSLPNNERYYQITRGSVQLFALDSDNVNEPDGTTADSKQGHWLEAQLGAAQAPWRLVFFHHPPYSSSTHHGSTLSMRWPFAEWGASIVYAGHDHTYERLAVDGFPYIVNGVGGNEDLYELGEPLPESLVRHADVHGLVLVTATATDLVSRFLDERGQELDVLSLHRE
jgi:tartrate-resistant acid phosphatase type 5